MTRRRSGLDAFEPRGRVDTAESDAILMPLSDEAIRQGWRPRMIPGQTPYKIGELLALQRLIGDAADLQDSMTPSELDQLERDAGDE